MFVCILWNFRRSDLPSKKHPSRSISPHTHCVHKMVHTNQGSCWLQVLSQLRVVARAEGSAERFDREVWSAELSPLLNLWKKLNQVTHTNPPLTSSHLHSAILSLYHLSTKVSPPSDKVESPVLAFVSLERFNAVRLVQSVHSSLASLNRVLRGSSLLSTDVHNPFSDMSECECVWVSEW